MSLCLHAGAERITRDQLAALPLPPSMGPRHVVRPFIADVEMIDGFLQEAGFALVDESYGVKTKDGMPTQMFGAIEIRPKTLEGQFIPAETDKSFALTIGLRGSYDQTLPRGLAVGSRVFVCDNTAFRASDAVVQFSRKHTKFILRDFPKMCIDKVAELPGYFADTEQQIDRWKNCLLGTDPIQIRRNAADLCMTALTKGATNGRLLPRVWSEFNREDGPGGHTSLKGNSLWSLFNAFTEVEKISDSPAESQRRTARLSTILDGTCREIDDAREEDWSDSLLV
mgnify:CR=1 FL=1